MMPALPSMKGAVAFYAPMKPPDHPIPSGDRKMARLLMQALGQAGYRVALVSRFRSYDRDGNAQRQARIKAVGQRLAARLIERWRRGPEQRPCAWVTYHLYHKSPDWLGPAVTAALDIPYVVAEASFAPRQANGPWRVGFDGACGAIRQADQVLALTAVDEAGLKNLVPADRLMRLPPFLDLDAAPQSRLQRAQHRRRLAERFGLAPEEPWLLAVGMMRQDAKLCSYRLLAAALARLKDRPWQLLIVGDGPSRVEVERLFDSLRPKGVSFLGILPEDALSTCYAAADVYAWPAVQEAYGLALLEAEAAGLPVVAGQEGGVADVVVDGITGLLVPPRDPEAFAKAVAALLDDPVRRRVMGQEAAQFVRRERGLDHAGKVMERALHDAGSRGAAGSLPVGRPR